MVYIMVSTEYQKQYYEANKERIKRLVTEKRRERAQNMDIKKMKMIAKLNDGGFKRIPHSRIAKLGIEFDGDKYY